VTKLCASGPDLSLADPGRSHNVTINPRQECQANIAKSPPSQLSGESPQARVVSPWEPGDPHTSTTATGSQRIHKGSRFRPPFEPGSSSIRSCQPRLTSPADTALQGYAGGPIPRRRAHRLPSARSVITLCDLSRRPPQASSRTAVITLARANDLGVVVDGVEGAAVPSSSAPCSGRRQGWSCGDCGPPAARRPVSSRTATAARPG
jgi:hypothetical protein